MRTIKYSNSNLIFKVPWMSKVDFGTILKLFNYYYYSFVIFQPWTRWDSASVRTSSRCSSWSLIVSRGAPSSLTTSSRSASCYGHSPKPSSRETQTSTARLRSTTRTSCRLPSLINLDLMTFLFLTNHFRLSWTGLHPQSLATCSSWTSDNNIHVDMSLCSLYRLLPAVLCFVSCVQRVTEATGNHARNLPLSGSV